MLFKVRTVLHIHIFTVFNDCIQPTNQPVILSHFGWYRNKKIKSDVMPISLVSKYVSTISLSKVGIFEQIYYIKLLQKQYYAWILIPFDEILKMFLYWLLYTYPTNVITPTLAICIFRVCQLFFITAIWSAVNQGGFSWSFLLPTFVPLPTQILSKAHPITSLPLYSRLTMTRWFSLVIVHHIYLV